MSDAACNVLTTLVLTGLTALGFVAGVIYGRWEEAAGYREAARQRAERLEELSRWQGDE